ncbi:MAG TPA: hypothetical protein VJS13_06990 [Pyrinomonadaceae bacterium]|nr:hypothetical protein [Pyrinomonadaceae bacterium]
MYIKSSLLPLLVLLLIILGPTKLSSASVFDQGPTARGAGGFTNTSPFRPGVYEFSFEAVANKNGRAHGRAVFDNLTAQTHIEIKIDCLLVLESNNASINGTVLHSTDPELPKGTRVVFGAVDDRESPFSDIITPAFPSGTSGCDNFLFPLTFFQIDGDAIQIEP